MTKRILVVTSCTGEKQTKPENQLVLDDFRDQDRLKQREAELADHKLKARDMYTGRQHLELMKGVASFRAKYPDAKLDVAILSAGYGLLHEEDQIVPYEVTFNNMGVKEIETWSATQGMTESFKQKLNDEKYDLVFLLLGDKYLRAIDWSVEIAHQKLIFFAAKMSASKVLIRPEHYMLMIGEREAAELGAGLIAIKGYLFAQLLEYFVEHPDASWDAIYETPELVRPYILSSTQKSNQMRLFEGATESTDGLLTFETYRPQFHVEPEQIAKNYRSAFNFFIPENDDRVDPDYDFAQDRHKDPHRNPLTHDYYAHQFFNNRPNYDGVLISKVNIDRSARKRSMIAETNIHEFLRLPADVPIMGDCGAFSYIGLEEPPYTSEQVLEYYHTMGFDYGVSVDHLIVGNIEKNVEERERRYNITIQNADDFLKKYNQLKDIHNYRFTPIGVAQGWDPISFRDAVQALINMGYTHFALGGLAKEKSTKIFEILKEIAPLMREDFRMHLFGVARDEDIMESFRKLGVTSFDSASPLRRAWMDAKHNYYTAEGQTYVAIRIPEAKENKGRVKNLLAVQGGDFAVYRDLETRALAALRRFDAGELDIEETLEAILAYDQLLGGNRSRNLDAYRRVLTDAPWRQCGCPICQEIGIDVIIFRGNNRNRRRGFHNTHVYYNRLQRIKNN